jgi:hypothetical protein
MALTNLMSFVDSAAFAARPEIGPFDILNNVTMNNARRALINRYYTHQFGQVSIEHSAAARVKTPSETLSELRSMFAELDATDASRVITICDTSSVNNKGCHSVTPYLLDQVSAEDKTWSLLVYDNNLPGDYPTIEIDAASDSWMYTPLNFAGDKLFFLEDPLSNYTGNAVMTAAPRETPPVATAVEGCEIYVSPADSVMFQSTAGTVGKRGDTLVNQVMGASPIVPRAADGEPIGYLLPDRDWTCRVTGSSEDAVCITAIMDSLMLCYRRDRAIPEQSETVDIRDGNSVYMHNPDDTGRVCDIDIVCVEADRELLLALGNLPVASTDSTAVELTPETWLRIVNHGGASTYDVLLRDVSGDGLLEFSHDSVAMAGDAAHRLEPDWTNVNSGLLRLVIDNDLDGIYEDTTMLSNNTPTDVDDEADNNLPARFELSQNYPNPFNPSTTIKYAVPSRSRVTIEVFNVLGRKVRTLINEVKPAGFHTITWDGDNAAGRRVASGVYLYRFQAGDHIETRKMLLLK